MVPLEITGLTKIFETPSGPFTAVKDVNAKVHPGEFVCILGHSGCGKSTVLSIVRRTSEGDIRRRRHPRKTSG
jgi:ABC-type glutathione transport system ATPase component